MSSIPAWKLLIVGLCACWALAATPLSAQVPVPLPDIGEDDGVLDVQNAPGDDYGYSYNYGDYPSTAVPPDYVYQPYYYDDPYGGARPLADYAPPGYVTRDQQDGPGEAEFMPLFPPAPITAADRESFVVRGIYPGSFLVPGTNTSVRLRGFVRLAALFDFDPIGSTDSFVTNTIPVPQEIGQNYNMSGRISRFALETWTPTSHCDWNVHTLIEGDFFNGPAQAAGGGGNPFRLRHAFFDFGYFRFGQQNTVFMDPTSWPSLVDFQGPNSWVNQRQPSVRMTLPLTDRWFWATSMERPFSDITTNNMGAAVQDVPDFATHVRYEGDLGHLQLAGLLRTIGYRPTDEEVSRLVGAGISGTAVFHPWALLLGTDPVHDVDPSGLTRSRILLQATWGPGVGRYLNDLPNQGLDAQVNPLTGAFELVSATGWNASYENWFNAHVLANFTFASVSVDNNADQPGATYNNANYLASSLWWVPIPGMSLGLEFMWGERENLDGQAGRVRRLHGMCQYNF